MESKLKRIEDKLDNLLSRIEKIERIVYRVEEKTIEVPKSKYSGTIVTELFSRFYKKTEEGIINTRQEEFGRGIYDFYSKHNYISTKQFDALNKLVAR